MVRSGRDQAMTKQRRARQTAAAQFTAHPASCHTGWADGNTSRTGTTGRARQCGRVSREFAVKRAGRRSGTTALPHRQDGRRGYESAVRFLGQQRSCSMLRRPATEQGADHNVLATIFKPRWRLPRPTEVFKTQIEAEVRACGPMSRRIAGVKAQSKES